MSTYYKLAFTMLGISLVLNLVPFYLRWRNRRIRRRM